MKRSLHERAKAFFINMGRKSRILKGPAILGLAFSMLLHRIFEYCRKGTKRFICAAFVLLCFMAGNSFAYPVFQEESGFVSGEDKEKMITAVNIISTTTPKSRQAVERFSGKMGRQMRAERMRMYLKDMMMQNFMEWKMPTNTF